MMIDLRQIKGGLALKQLVDQLNTSYDASKVIIDGTDESVKAAVTRLEQAISTTESKLESKKADLTYVNEELAKKAVKADVDAEFGTVRNEVRAGLDLKANIADLGTAAAKNVGNGVGQLPMVGEDGKISSSVLPSIAINETFVVASKEEAMSHTLENGDVVIINVEGGSETFIAVDVTKEVFEEKFRPLLSSADTVTKAHLDSELAKKADKTQVASDIEAAKTEAANDATNKVEAAKTMLNQAISGVDGKLNSLDTLVKGDITKKIEDNAKAIEDAKEEVTNSFTPKITAVENRATDLERRATTVEGRATAVEDRATALEGRADGIDTKLGEHKGYIDNINQEISDIKAHTFSEVSELFTVNVEGQTEFTLKNTPEASKPVKVYINGFQYIRTMDWDIAGNVVTWKNTDFELGAGFHVFVEYYK